jgi:mRNA-degrading endonuclease toxin of MazEF toxin-antitoxin module
MMVRSEAMPFPSRVRMVDFTFTRYPSWADVYWYDFGVPRAQQHTIAEPHLALVVSDTRATLRGTVCIVPLSGAEHQKAGYLFHVLLPKSEVPQLDKDSLAKVDQIYCVPTQPGLPDQYYLTTLKKKTMARVYEPLLRALGIQYLMGNSGR